MVGDVVGASLKDAARTQYGPIDITITPSADVDLGDVVAAVSRRIAAGWRGRRPSGEPGRAWGFGSFSFEGFDFSRSSESPFADIMERFFSGRTNRTEPERGQNLEYQMALSFEESIRGVRTAISSVWCAMWSRKLRVMR